MESRAHIEIDELPAVNDGVTLIVSNPELQEKLKEPYFAEVAARFSTVVAKYIALLGSKEHPFIVRLNDEILLFFEELKKMPHTIAVKKSGEKIAGTLSSGIGRHIKQLSQHEEEKKVVELHGRRFQDGLLFLAAAIEALRIEEVRIQFEHTVSEQIAEFQSDIINLCATIVALEERIRVANQRLENLNGGVVLIAAQNNQAQGVSDAEEKIADTKPDRKRAKSLSERDAAQHARTISLNQKQAAEAKRASKINLLELLRAQTLLDKVQRVSQKKLLQSSFVDEMKSTTRVLKDRGSDPHCDLDNHITLLEKFLRWDFELDYKNHAAEGERGAPVDESGKIRRYVVTATLAAISLAAAYQLRKNNIDEEPPAQLSEEIEFLATEVQQKKRTVREDLINAMKVFKDANAKLDKYESLTSENLEVRASYEELKNEARRLSNEIGDGVIEAIELELEELPITFYVNTAFEKGQEVAVIRMLKHVPLQSYPTFIEHVDVFADAYRSPREISLGTLGSGDTVTMTISDFFRIYFIQAPKVRIHFVPLLREVTGLETKTVENRVRWMLDPKLESAALQNDEDILSILHDRLQSMPILIMATPSLQHKGKVELQVTLPAEVSALSSMWQRARVFIGAQPIGEIKDTQPASPVIIALEDFHWIHPSQMKPEFEFHHIGHPPHRLDARLSWDVDTRLRKPEMRSKHRPRK